LDGQPAQDEPDAEESFAALAAAKSALALCAPLISFQHVRVHQGNVGNNCACQGLAKQPNRDRNDIPIPVLTIGNSHTKDAR
jgi:hypothetical protein